MGRGRGESKGESIDRLIQMVEESIEKRDLKEAKNLYTELKKKYSELGAEERKRYFSQCQGLYKRIAEMGE